MSRHTALPISLYVEGRTVVVVGNSDAAERRARRFEAAGATVRRVAPDDFSPLDCEDAFLVAFQEPVDGAPAAVRAAGVLVYVHDAPDESDVAMPGLVQRGPLKIAISTDGAAPALTRRLRQQLQAFVDAAGDDLDALLAEIEAARGNQPKERLNELAARLEIKGAIELKAKR